MTNTYELTGPGLITVTLPKGQIVLPLHELRNALKVFDKLWYDEKLDVDWMPDFDEEPVKYVPFAHIKDEF